MNDVTRGGAIYAASMPGSAVTLIEQVRKAGIELPLLSGDGWADKDIIDASEQQGIKDIYFTTHRFLGIETAGMKAFVDAYRRKFGAAPPNAFAPLGFDSVNLLADAIQRAGWPTGPKSARASLRLGTSRAWSERSAMCLEHAYPKRQSPLSESTMGSRHPFGLGPPRVNNTWASGFSDVSVRSTGRT
jgi:hypothetical protein